MSPDLGGGPHERASILRRQEGILRRANEEAAYFEANGWEPVAGGWRMSSGGKPIILEVNIDETKPKLTRRQTPYIDCPTIVQAWPEQMRADTAAEFCGERSASAFRRGVGTLYPSPYRVPGKGDRWSKQELEKALTRLRAGQNEVEDAADIL